MTELLRLFLAAFIQDLSLMVELPLFTNTVYPLFNLQYNY